MGKNSGVQWCNHTVNIAWGCEKYDALCKNCYAQRLDHRWHKDNPHWGANAPRLVLSEQYWKNPLLWNKECEKNGVRERVFCSSMADWAEDHPTIAQQRLRLFPLIKKTPHLDWLLLTKRYNKIQEFLPEDWSVHAYPNVWLGQSVGKQELAEKYLDVFLLNEAMVLFLSVEPLLEYVNLKPWLKSGRISWVIIGGESGNPSKPNSYRDCKIEWFEKIIDDCRAYNVPVFFKQLGTAIATSLKLTDKHGGLFEELPDNLKIREFPKGH